MNPGEFEKIRNNQEKITLDFKPSEERSGVFEILINEKRAGSFALIDPLTIDKVSERKAKQFKHIHLDDFYRGKGIGKELYIKINDFLKKLDGSTLQSSDYTEESAYRVWQSLLNDGLVEKIGPAEDGKDQYQFL